MKINPNVEIAVQKYIQEYMVRGTCSIKELLRNYKSSVPTTEAELRNTINNALRAGNLQIIGRVERLAKIHIISRKSQLSTLILKNAKQIPAEV